jgi:hypothetical protein
MNNMKSKLRNRKNNGNFFVDIKRPIIYYVI